MGISPSQPIGLFDSGVGGLTVAHAIRSVLPGERLVYFGDTFHLPYGDKSSDSVKYYAVRISDFLLEQQCKVILIACNTASSSAYREVAGHVGDRALVMNVVDPVAGEVAAGYREGKIGVIGTKGTINSRTYPSIIGGLNPGLEVVSLATPLLVPMIEEGFIFDDISNAIIRAYLSDPVLEGISGLILGCTHYPIIRRQIEKYFDFNVRVIDSAAIVAGSLKKLLAGKDLLNNSPAGPDHFYVSDYTDYFGKIARLFFEEDLELEQIDFWK
jgi:glutamate racemase